MNYGKKLVDLQVHMLVEIMLEGFQVLKEDAIGGTYVWRERKVVGQLLDFCHRYTSLVVLGLHHGNVVFNRF